MAINIYPLAINGSSDLRIITDSDTDETCEGNVFDGAATVFAVYGDNTANAALTYMKFYDLDTPVTVGTTAPSMILMFAASARVFWVFTNGVTFNTGLSFAAVTAAGTGGTTGPTSAVVTAVVTG